MKFSAVAFDLDGTLYPNFRLYARLLPFILKELRLLKAFGKTRTMMRKDFSVRSGENFYDAQARVLGKILRCSMEEARERTEKLIYRGWEPLFNKIRLFPHVLETLDAFRKEGIKLGLLSDFPPEVKLKNLNLGGFWDVIMCSEHTGHLKPDVKPFLDLAALMGRAPEQILYVGNSVPYDVKGSRRAGMKSAHIRSKWKKFFSPGEADFVFYDYRQLRDYVLG